MLDHTWKLEFVFKARENLRTAKAGLPRAGTVIEEYDDWATSGYVPGCPAARV